MCRGQPGTRCRPRPGTLGPGATDMRPLTEAGGRRLAVGRPGGGKTQERGSRSPMTPPRSKKSSRGCHPRAASQPCGCAVWPSPHSSTPAWNRRTLGLSSAVASRSARRNRAEGSEYCPTLKNPGKMKESKKNQVTNHDTYPRFGHSVTQGKRAGSRPGVGGMVDDLPHSADDLVLVQLLDGGPVGVGRPQIQRHPMVSHSQGLKPPSEKGP